MAARDQTVNERDVRRVQCVADLLCFTLLGTVVFTLPAEARPVYTHTFAVNVHSTTEDLFVRVDVLPNGNVVVSMCSNFVKGEQCTSYRYAMPSTTLRGCLQAQQGFAQYVAIDGISFETTNSSDWEPLLDTLPTAQKAVFTPAPAFAPPSFKASAILSTPTFPCSPASVLGGGQHGLPPRRGRAQGD